MLRTPVTLIPLGTSKAPPKVAFRRIAREYFSRAACASSASNRYGFGGLGENIMKITNKNIIYMMRPRAALALSIGTINILEDESWLLYPVITLSRGRSFRWLEILNVKSTVEKFRTATCLAICPSRRQVKSNCFETSILWGQGRVFRFNRIYANAQNIEKTSSQPRIHPRNNLDKNN